MANELKLPELGEGIEEAQVLSVLISVGDTVKKDQAVIEVETEKATAEVPTDFEGTVTAVHVKVGQPIRVGEAIITVDGAASSAASDAGAEAASSGNGAGETKAAAEPEAPAAAEPVKQRAAKAKPVERAPGPLPEPVRSSDPAPVASGSGSDPGSGAAKIVYLEEREVDAAHSVPASPSVRRLARELGVSINDVPATGSGGRVSAEDVKSFARRLIADRAAPGPRPVASPAAPAQSRSLPTLPDFTQWGDVERQPMSALRRAAADALATAWANAPMVTQFDRADITELESFRKRYGKRVEAAGEKLTVTAMAVKVAAAALRVFPKFNASLDMAAQEVVLKKYVHVGVAVDTPMGLMVPVIRDADAKNVTEIAAVLQDLAERARTRKIALDELKGGTFSVSNLGGLGTTYFSPIVNWPEAAILGLGRASVEAVHVDGAFVPRKVLPLAVTYDHRLIDGADAARFLRWIAEALENPMLLALEG